MSESVHPIQLSILAKLLKSIKLRYSEIKPHNIENDLFNYHLQFLVKSGLVDKSHLLYSLTNEGKQFVQNLDSQGKMYQLFRISVIPFVVRVVSGKREILLHRNLRHPYYGEVTSVAGKVLIGEKIESAAERKCKEETGLQCVFTLIGLIRKIRRDKKGKVIQDTLYHVCYGENPVGTLVSKNEFGENFWGSFTEALKYEKQNVTHSQKSAEIIKRIENKNLSLFYFSEEIVLKKY
jgi:ADP-ribose pyrophosphatase YjhB (NUDIX family)/predicted transcriptional regulator